LLRAGLIALLCVLVAGCGATKHAAPSLQAVVVAVPPGNGAPPFDVPRRLVIPAGWSAQVWARVGAARFAVWSPDGSLLVSRPLAGTVVRLDPARDQAAPPRRSVLVSGLSDPQGLAFDMLDGRPVLYVAESDQLDRYAWDGAKGVGARTVVARGLPDQDGIDRRKGVAVGPDHRIYVSVGSLSQRPGPQGVVVAFGPRGAEVTFATGVGNGPGLAIDPAGALWTAANRGRGAAPDGLARLTAGRHLGQVDRPIGAHSAPLGFEFVKLPAPWSRGAVLAVHGSFAPRLRAPALLWFPWAGGTLGPPRTLVSGYRLADGTRWGRPVDAVQGPDGALYVTDDTAGAVYRLVPSG
jgi:glucose/arabinose dehydrogenase